MKNTIPYLTACSSTPAQDAQWLLSDTLQVSHTYLYTYPNQTVTALQQQDFDSKIQRRRKGEPIAYILGHQGFWTLDLQVTPDVLIPRPETELLIEIILQKYGDKKSLKIADLGTGSGAIALALAKERSQWQMTATDYSAAALSIAKKNARRLTIENVRFLMGDWCDALPQEKFDIIVSNPPYIANHDPHLNADSLPFEPPLALIAGSDGLEAIVKISSQAKNYLSPQGLLLLEHGFNQADSVKNILQKEGYCQILCQRDLNGHGRVTEGYLSS